MAKTGVLGRLAYSAGIAGTDAIVYRVPTGNAATVTINVVQKAGATAVMDMAILPPGQVSITGQDVIFFDFTIDPLETIEKKGVVLGSQEAIVVNFNSGGPTVIVWGFEEVD